MLASCLMSKAQKILDARFGIGNIKNVYNAQQDGSFLMESALLLIIYVKAGNQMESANHVIKVIYLRMENANILNCRGLKI